MVEVLRGIGAEGLRQTAVECLVRKVILAADDVCDPEVDVVDDGGQVVGRAAVRAQERWVVLAPEVDRSLILVRRPLSTSRPAAAW